MQTTAVAGIQKFPYGVDQSGPATIEFPCTLAQQRYWRLDRAYPGDPTLNIAARWRLEGGVSPALLERALNELVKRHEPLRTGFGEADGGIPVQRVMPLAQLTLRLVDLIGRPEAEAAATVDQLAREEARRAFDLARPPLLRATLVRLGSSRADVLVTTHEMVGDCWSNGILAREMATLYEALHAGSESKLTAFDMQYGDYARWQEAWIAQGGSLAAEAYWQQRLARLPAFHVPTSYAPPAVPSRQGEIFGIPAPCQLTEAAQRMAREHGATFFMLGVATLAALLHRWTGAFDVVFGTQVAGRDEVELEDLVGPFVNTLALRVDVAGDPVFEDLLDQVRGNVGDALEHAAAPIERVIEALEPVTRAAERRYPLTAVNFLIQRAFTRDAEHGAFTLAGMPNASPGSRYDLNVFLVERSNGWRVSCEYDTDLFAHARIEWLINAFVGVLAAVVAEPTRRLSTIALPSSPSSEGVLPDAALADCPSAEAPVPGAVSPDAAPKSGAQPRFASPGAAQPVPPPVVLAPAALAPAAELDQQRLAEIWAKVLRRKNIPHDANFFEYGGDSIRAVRMLALTRQTFGRGISLGHLFKAPTLAAMAASLRGETDATLPDAAPEGVVMVQPEGNRPPVFAINNTGIFHTLSRHLGTEQPFIAIQALDPNVSPALHPTAFNDIVARYVATIRQVRPHGPYVLIGLCVAGKVAFEVVRQLSALGEEVPLLAVVDAWAPGHIDGIGFRRRLLALSNLRTIRFLRQLQRIREGTLSISAFLANRGQVRRLRNTAFELLRRAGLRHDVPPGVQNDLFVSHLEVAARGYTPRPYAGRVLVFYGPEQPRGRFLDPSFGWLGLVAGQVEVVAVPADQHTRFEDHHQGLFQDPGAKVMADHITAALR